MNIIKKKFLLLVGYINLWISWGQSFFVQTFFPIYWFYMETKDLFWNTAKRAFTKFLENSRGFFFTKNVYSLSWKKTSLFWDSRKFSAENKHNISEPFKSKNIANHRILKHLQIYSRKKMCPNKKKTLYFSK